MEGVVYQISIKPVTPGEHGLPKKPVNTVQVTVHGLVGDFNHFRHEKHHDDPAMAVLIFPLETILQMNQEGWPVRPGDVGENFTTKGIPYEHFSLGQQYRVGGVVIEVSKVCTPCKNLKNLYYVGEERKADFIKTMLGRRGWYARVLKEGTVEVNDNIKQI